MIKHGSASHRCLAYLGPIMEASTAEIARGTGQARHSLYGPLHRLEGLGLVVSFGTARRLVWGTTDEGDDLLRALVSTEPLYLRVAIVVPSTWILSRDVVRRWPGRETPTQVNSALLHLVRVGVLQKRRAKGRNLYRRVSCG